MKEYLEQDISEINLETLVQDALNEALTNEEGLKSAHIQTTAIKTLKNIISH